MELPGFEQNLTCPPLGGLRIDDPFWNRYTRLVTEEILPYQLDSLLDRVPGAPPSRCIRNLRIAAGLEEGTFDGFVFQDTDLAKWLEAAAYSLAWAPDPELEKTADALIDLIEKAQEDNGYLNSYFSILHPGKQFCNLREGHELYTAGHFIEAAVAYYKTTGKDKFLRLMCRFADLICRVFRQEDYRDAVPGHEEIELALFRLWEATGQDDYRAMAYEFINRRGTTDYLIREHTLDRFVGVWRDPGPYLPQYAQAHLPVREQDTAEGHAVRALYLYSAMADLAWSFQDESLLNACVRLYENITGCRMYITGGVGSSGTLERFTADFDLPNDTNYSESCASIALAMFCKRMARATGEARYMDTAELALYNTVLAGVAMDGKSFFYVNPLEVVPSVCLPSTDKGHVQPVRQKWFGCACCPPNIARTLASLSGYIFLQGEDSLRVDLYVGGTYRVRIGDTPVELTVKSGLPFEGTAELTLRAAKPMRGALLLRIPDDAGEPRLWVNGTRYDPQMHRGYARIEPEGTLTRAELRFDMPARLIYADPRVSADAGKCAVKKGPLVYCLEEADNGANLAGLQLDPEKPLRETDDGTLPGVAVEAEGLRLRWSGGLYDTKAPDREPCTLRFVPYCFWGNRGPGEMAVWVRLRCGYAERPVREET